MRVCEVLEVQALWLLHKAEPVSRLLQCCKFPKAVLTYTDKEGVASGDMALTPVSMGKVVCTEQTLHGCSANMK